MTAFWDWIRNEPVGVAGLLTAAVGVGTHFGLHWTPDQVTEVTAFFGILANLIARNTVTPVAKIARNIPVGLDVPPAA